MPSLTQAPCEGSGTLEVVKAAVGLVFESASFAPATDLAGETAYTLGVQDYGFWWGRCWGETGGEGIGVRTCLENGALLKTQKSQEIQVLPLDLHLSFVSLGIITAIFVSQEEI